MLPNEKGENQEGEGTHWTAMLEASEEGSEDTRNIHSSSCLVPPLMRGCSEGQLTRLKERAASGPRESRMSREHTI
jgi:hypothetical protein